MAGLDLLDYLRDFAGVEGDLALLLDGGFSQRFLGCFLLLQL